MRIICRLMPALAALILGTNIGLAKIGAEVPQTSSRTSAALTLAGEGSLGCVNVNKGEIDLQIDALGGGGIASVGVGNFNSGEWLTVETSTSVTLTTFLDVFDRTTRRTLRSTLVANLDPLMGKDNTIISINVSELEAKRSFRIIAGYEGTGSFIVTVRCTTHDPRRLSLLSKTRSPSERTSFKIAPRDLELLIRRKRG